MWFRSKLRRSCAALVVLLVCATQLAVLVWAQAPGAASGVTVRARPATPTITLLSPSSGAVGATVTITGSGFNASQGTGTVTFNGVTATASSWSPLSITVTVPSGASTGNVVVTQNAIASSGSAFTVSGGGVPCNQTVSVGANLNTILNGMSAGQTLCLNTGNWGDVTITATPAGTITVKSVSGVGAHFTDMHPGGSHNITLDHVTIDYMIVNGAASQNLTVQHSVAGGPVGAQHNWEIDCSIGHTGLVFDDDTFINSYDSNGSGHEGRLDFYAGGNCHATVKNSLFQGASPNACSDGIQVDASGIEIGPGNIFLNIVEGSCGPHADAIQLTGAGSIHIFSNWFAHGSTFIMSPDSCSNVTVEKNVFDGTGDGNDFQLQFGACSNLIFRHNTLMDSGIAVDSKPGDPASTNALLENNIYTGDTTIKMSGGSGCSGCTTRFGLWSVSGNASGTNNVIGTPVYMGGGSAPSTWPGWQLTVASPGHNAGNDGTDMGTTYYGP